MNVAVIGCGYWGPNIIRNFFSIPGCKMDFCADLDPKNLEKIHSHFPGIRVTTNYKDILNAQNIDAVAIATPLYTHHALAKECLQANKHVLVEKPLAASRVLCLDLIRIAREMDKVLMVGHTFEYTSAVNKAREILRQGELGEILYVSSMRLNLGLFQPDINVVWDLAPHDISILLYLLENQPVAVNGQGKGHYCEKIEDVATATLHFQNGQIAFLHQSWLSPNKVRKMTLVGTKKMMVYDDVLPQEKIKIFDKGVDGHSSYDSLENFHFAYRDGDIFSPRLDNCEPLKVECEHFLECIREKKTPKSDGWAGLQIVTILEAICESIRKKGAVIQIPAKDETIKFVNKKQEDIYICKV